MFGPFFLALNLYFGPVVEEYILLWFCLVSVPI